MSSPDGLSIRAAAAADRAEIDRIVERAFRPEDVVTFLAGLRADGCVLLEMVAEDKDGIVGHIAFSRVAVEDASDMRHPAAILTPLSVRPDRQGRGIGTALMMRGLDELDRRGEGLCFVLGHPAYYPRAGFSAEAAEAVAAPWSGPAFMARGGPIPEGRLVVPPTMEAEARGEH